MFDDVLEQVSEEVLQVDRIYLQHLESHSTIPIFHSSGTRLLTADELKTRYVMHCLDICDGNLMRAARLLGMHRRTVQRILSKKRSL